MTELVETVVAALNRRDWEGLFALAAPEFEYDLTRTDSPLRGVYGREEMARVLDDFLGSWESVRYEPHEVVEGDGCVVIPFTTHFLGRDGIEMRSEAAWLWTIRDGALARVTLFQDRAEALEAAGISG